MGIEDFSICMGEVILYLLNSSNFSTSLEAAKRISQEELMADQKKQLIINFILLKDKIVKNKYDNLSLILNTLKLNEPVLDFIFNFYAYKDDYSKVKNSFTSIDSLNFKTYECQSVLNEMLQLAIFNRDEQNVKRIINKLKE